MLKCFLLLLATLVTARAAGDFAVLHSPDGVVFHGGEEVEQSLVKDVLTAALGYSVKKGSWSGMSITDPFNVPEAVVAVVVEGIDSLGMSNSTVVEKYPLVVNEAEETTWQAVRLRVEKRGSVNTVVRFSLGDGLDALGQSALGELKPTPIDAGSLNSLSLENEQHRKFLEEIQLLRAIAKNVPVAIKSDSKPDIYWFVVGGIGPIIETHGKNSSEAKEALALFADALKSINDAFVHAYTGKVVIAAFTNDASQARHTRSVVLDRGARDVQDGQEDREGDNKSVEEEEDKDTDNSSPNVNEPSTTTPYSDISEENERSDQDNTNPQEIGQADPAKVIDSLATKYDEDYPVIFNIVLWFGIVFFFSLLAICIAIADMDPGRDSIIYRMTSNRMKKDN